MSKPPHNSALKKAAMIQALEKSLGIVTTACKSIGIDRNTHYNWYKSDPDYAAKVDELENIALDFAESQLHKQINKGEVAATIFYLKTKGRKRGYTEEITIKQSTATVKPEIPQDIE